MTAPELVSDYLPALLDKAEEAWHRFEQLILLSPEGGSALMFVSVVALVVLAVLLYLRLGALRQRHIIAVSSCIPLVALALTVGQPALKGVPDERCQKYGEGQVEFRLLSTPALLPIDPAKPYGDSWLVLTVESVILWGKTAHVCRLPLTTDQGRKVFALFVKYREEIAKMATRDGSTNLIFTFGNKAEEPRAATPQRDPDGFSKDGPPERAQGI